MKISSIKKLLIEEFPIEVKGWIDSLFQPLNKALSQTNEALSGQLTIGDNIKGLVKSVDVASNISRFTWTVNEKPNALFCGYIVEIAASPGAIPIYSMSWGIDNANQITVTFIGLDTAKKYKARIIGLV